MLGYGNVALRYAYEMPRTLSQHGYYSASIGRSLLASLELMEGKDHFGWNASSNQGISHGFEHTLIYDGLGDGRPEQNDTVG
jgi:hypothetical protein